MSPASAAPGAEVLGKLTGTIESGWHLYSITTPPGPIPTTIRLADNPAVESLAVYQPKPERKFDPNFNADTETYTEKVTFLLKIKLAKAASGDVELVAMPRYQVCSATQCIPPVTKKVSAKVTFAPGSPRPPPCRSRRATPKPGPARHAAAEPDTSLLAFLGVAFGFGLASIFTPCVFPMIPITMSFFLNKQGASKAAIVTQAAIFCIGIVVLFTALGLIVTSILGPFGVVQLGSNVWVNGVIATVFLVFGLSLLGAFEITLPSGLLTTLNQKSEQGGTLGTLLMGLTFALASFACVGPFMGTLLAASVQGGGARPVLGMLVFAAGLALPFFLLALFPQYLKKMPRSGGWLARVKVVMGFIVLAAMFKYLAAIDQVMQWNAGHARAIPGDLGGAVRHGWTLPARLPAARRRQARREDRHGTSADRHGVSRVRAVADSRYVRQPSRRTGNVRAAGHRRQRVGRRAAKARSRVDEERPCRSARARAQREETGAGQLHRLRLHQLPLDEGQHVHAAGDRRA